jgi:RNA polymerase sigma-70 factor (ECF subfamily)
MPTTLDEYRAFLLALANRELPQDLRPKVAPSDLVQDAMLSAHARLAVARPRCGELRPWLRGILLNKVGELVRRYVTAGKRSIRRERAPLDPAAGRDSPAAGQGPRTELIRADARDVVNRTVARLRDEDRNVVAWRIHDGLSFDEIAARLGKSRDAAEQIYRRALKKLRGLLPPQLDPGAA